MERKATNYFYEIFFLNISSGARKKSERSSEGEQKVCGALFAIITIARMPKLR